MADPKMEQIRSSLQSQEYGPRGYAMQSLLNMVRRGAAGRDEAIELFRHCAAQDPHPWPAALGIHGVEYLEGAEAARPYWVAMLHHQDVQMAERAAMSLKERSYVPDLLGVLERRVEPRIQTTVIRALGRLKDPAAFPAIIARLGDAELRPHVVEALGDLGDPQALPYLEPLLQDGTPTWPIDNHGPMLYIRDHAAASIHQIRASKMPHHAPSSTPASQSMPVPQTRIVVPPPLPTPRRALNLHAYVPLIAAVMELPWVGIVIILQLMRTGTPTHDPSATRLLDLLAMIPAISGVLTGIYAARRWSRMSIVEKVFLVIGSILCALIMIPFTVEMLQ